MQGCPHELPLSVLIITIGPRPNPELQKALIRQGLQVWTAASRYDVPSLLALRDWSLVLLDLNHPQGESLRICREIRQKFPGPLAAVTAMTSVEDQIKILKTGMDDHFVWPMPSELMEARLRNLIRRLDRLPEVKPTAQPPLQIGDIVIDPARQEVRREGLKIELTTLELELLQLLASHVGQTVSRERISHELRGLPHDTRDRSIDLRVSRLRRKLGDDCQQPHLILTVRGAGYLLAAKAL